jgi:hypothetical protein
MSKQKQLGRSPPRQPRLVISVNDLKEHYREQVERQVEARRRLDAVDPVILRAIVADGVLDSDIIDDASHLLADRLFDATLTTRPLISSRRNLKGSAS